MPESFEKICKLRKAVFVAALAICVAFPATSWAVDYKFCITGNKASGIVIVHSGTINMGREWYRIKATTQFCGETGSTSCTATDFDDKVCGKSQQYEYKYDWTNVDQGKLILLGVGSGNVPVVVGSIAETAVNTPAQAVVTAGKGVATGGKAVASGVHHAACHIHIGKCG
jgi:hypothetical protein